jgi:hypothetical protein
MNYNGSKLKTDGGEIRIHKKYISAPSDIVWILITFYVVLLKIMRKNISGIYKIFTTNYAEVYEVLKSIMLYNYAIPGYIQWFLCLL